MVLDMRSEIFGRPLPLDQCIWMQRVAVHEFEPLQASDAYTPAVLSDPVHSDSTVALYFCEGIQEPVRVFRMPGLLLLPGNARL